LEQRVARSACSSEKYLIGFPIVGRKFERKRLVRYNKNGDAESTVGNHSRRRDLGADGKTKFIGGGQAGADIPRFSSQTGRRKKECNNRIHWVMNLTQNLDLAMQAGK